MCNQNREAKLMREGDFQQKGSIEYFVDSVIGYYICYYCMNYLGSFRQATNDFWTGRRGCKAFIDIDEVGIEQVKKEVKSCSEFRLDKDLSKPPKRFEMFKDFLFWIFVAIIAILLFTRFFL